MSVDSRTLSGSEFRTGDRKRPTAVRAEPVVRLVDERRRCRRLVTSDTGV